MGKSKTRNKSRHMKKTTSIVLLTILALLIAVASVFTFVPFEMGLYDNNTVIGSIKLGIDLKGGVYVVLEPKIELEEGQEEPTSDQIKALNESLPKTMEIIRNRLFAKGYTEATVVQQNALGQEIGVPRIRVEIPDVDDPDEVFNIIGQTSKLEFMTGVTVNVGEKVNEGAAVRLEGDKHVKKAGVGRNENGDIVVSLEFNDAGAKLFAEVTGELNGTGNKLAIVVDGTVISAPTVNSVISDGKAVIEGGFDYESAENLALQIQSGSLPLTFEEIQPKTISATLGASTLKYALIAGAIGLVLIFIFMAVVYRGFGIIADIALLIYTFILLFLLAVLPWVQLTIQGIAGIILSIGMAVDANIIIIERIKDEYKSGTVFEHAIKKGFSRATSAILDSNITTIIASVVLWVLGTGTIKGFGVTLFIGIVLSMFTSLIVTRLLTKMFIPLSKSEKFYNLKKEEVAAHE